MSRRNIILMGPPGAGKGTQASAISRDLKLQHLSTGDVLRREVESQSVLGKQAKDFMNRGELVADQLIIDMVASFIRQHLQKNQGNANALQGFLYERDSHIATE
jgi:adenylate kinase